MNLGVLVPFLVLIGQHMSGAPAIPPGREPSVQALFGDCCQGETGHWRLGNIEIPSDRIRAHFKRDDGAAVSIELRFRQLGVQRDAETPSFDVFVVRREGLDAPSARAFARALARAIARQDRGDFWGKLSRPGNESHGRPGVLATYLWQGAFLALLALLLLAAIGSRPLRGSEPRLALVELGLLLALALWVRWSLVLAGPANLYSRLPSPWGPDPAFPTFGPGFDGWILLWYRLAGVRESTPFLAGAVAGALTVIPAYLLGWLGAGSRRAGLISATVLAVWPIHALHSTTDDFPSLLGLLLAISAASALLAAKAGSKPLLVAAWLAGGLAATVRPEAALSLAPLGALVLADPNSRRLQRSPLPAAITALILGATLLALLKPVSHATAHLSPWASLHPSQLAKLLGAGGSSLLGPPHSSWLLTALFAAGLPFLWRSMSWRGLLLLLLGLASAVPTLALAGPGFITARYQIPLAAFAAMTIGVGLDSMARFLAPRLGSWSRAALPIAGLALGAALARPLTLPAPEPTFRLEYRFFRRALEQIPAGCLLVRPRWSVDLGLEPPTHLTRLGGVGHAWVDASPDLNPRELCLIFWRPSSCRATGPGAQMPPGWQLPDCHLMESAYVLSPIVEAALPARRGFAERYLDNPVRVGFYRVHSRRLPPLHGAP